MWKDSETELDFLDFDYLKAILKLIINDEDLLPASVGVYGDWGSGKSSLIKMSMDELNKNKNTVCLIFNGWLFEGYEDAKTALMGSILDVIEKEMDFTPKAKACIRGLYKSIDKFKLLKSGAKIGADIFLTGGIGTLVDMGMNKVGKLIAEKISNAAKDTENISEIIYNIDLEKIQENIQEELSNKEIRNDIREFQNNFVELLKETKIEKLVIFVDELDRCSPDTILETLEAIRLFLFIGSVAFIIGADERHISYAVKKKFKEIEGLQIDIGKEYLEKMIQYPIRIPRLNSKEVEFYITCLFFQKDLTKKEFEDIIEYLNNEKKKEFLNFNLDYDAISRFNVDIAKKVKDSIITAKQLGAVLANGLNGNPRHCKRFLNSLYMRLEMAKYKQQDLDRKVLAKVMMLEYFKLPLFRKIAELVQASNDCSSTLKELEDDTINENSELKIWKEDNWVKQWAMSEPKISQIDLKPYFYFTRTSLDERFDLSVKKLSPLAQDTLKKLLSKSEIAIKSALKEASNINDNEASKILEEVFSQMVKESKIDIKLFNSFINWGSTREILTTDVISNLMSINGELIPLGAIPLVGSFINKSKRNSEMLEILERWKKENEKLQLAIDKIMKGAK
ncbi:KAP family P-loop NTPase fold protein [Clostridium cochlearium]|uniref:KAP family P-loop NTPase fold protein n=1 Tax=Clostridium cochlearium TaxID=1494 RepID=UPI000B949E71|nr:P-loop NTPase fold protein [Clostridium cochlearium]MBU5270135.1 KAP family NTPase [Clostridium cochlearium]MBU5270152.1 KAP family NTPase [Clostridium cochlearium]SNV83837.1 Predicted P-loop ATPase [Clostridium cochlearium]STA93138.1 Predicted P-loop ATPase [Clostridium cochlearium]